MKAMILAAGYGKRMRPLTDHTPKPLLQAGGKALIEYHIEKLRDGGIDSLVINTGWLGDRLAATLGDCIGEIDVNPLIAGPDGCMAVDAMVIGRRPGEEDSP